jgi:hypothetical protein
VSLQPSSFPVTALDFGSAQSGPAATLRRADATKLRAELATAKTEAEELDKQNEELQQYIAELEQAKDAVVVAKIRKKFSAQEFDNLVKAAKSAIRKLPRVVREAMLFYVRQDYFNPQYEDWGNDDLRCCPAKPPEG